LAALWASSLLHLLGRQGKAADFARQHSMAYLLHERGDIGGNALEDCSPLRS
jgi:hypothetical protein